MFKDGFYKKHKKLVIWLLSLIIWRKWNFSLWILKRSLNVPKLLVYFGEIEFYFLFEISLESKNCINSEITFSKAELKGAWSSSWYIFLSFKIFKLNYHIIRLTQNKLLHSYLIQFFKRLSSTKKILNFKFLNSSLPILNKRMPTFSIHHLFQFLIGWWLLL